MIILARLQSDLFTHLNGQVGADVDFYPLPDRSYPFVSPRLINISDLGVKSYDTGGVTLIFDIWSDSMNLAECYTISENIRLRMNTLTGYIVNFESAEIVNNITDEIKHMVINYSIV